MSGGKEEASGLDAGKIEALPDKPGVYIFYGDGCAPLYVGKAQSIRRRVRSYFQRSAGHNPRTAQLIAVARGIDYIVTANEAEALLLECGLIKRLKPPYNIMLRDDKTYPYITVTVEDDYPRVCIYRGERRPGKEYFGPYWHAGSARETLEALRRVYPFRTCRGERPGRGNRGPCLDRHIGLCPGPCRGGVSVEDYRYGIEKVRGFLGGRGQEVLRELEEKMARESDMQEYEKAARTRDSIAALRRVLEKQRVVMRDSSDMDVIGAAWDDLDICVTVIAVRTGQMTGKRDFVFPRPPEDELEEIIGGFLVAYYASEEMVPPLVLVPVDISEDRSGALTSWLEGQRGGKAVIRRPVRGEKRELLERASQNASVRLDMEKMKRASDLKWISQAMATLTRDLGLGSMPYRIECYDISNIGDDKVVGSMVVFEGGMPVKKDYRRFALRGGARDDASRLHEVLRRRLEKLAEIGGGAAAMAPNSRAAERLSSFQKAPQLILIDGGRAQLNAAMRALEESGLTGIELAAIAKRMECVYRPHMRDPVILPRESSALYLLQRLRDEAHRFAISYHRELRVMDMRASRLDGIRGIGKTRKAKLLEKYGSVEMLRRVDLEELKGLTFMDARSAENLYTALREG